MRLGFAHPDYLLPYLSAGQLLDWQRYVEQYGVGIDREDIHWGMLLSMYYNTNRGTGTEAKPATDFMPYHRQKIEDISPEAFTQQIRGLIRGKTVVRNSEP